MKYQALIPIESRLEGDEYANLKFINLSTHYKPGLALEIETSLKERVKTNHKRIRVDDTVICFIEVRFLQTYSPLRWSQKTGSLSTLSLSQTVT
jgi:hypothetical protein